LSPAGQAGFGIGILITKSRKIVLNYNKLF
jgi:hypothetical protein